MKAKVTAPFRGQADDKGAEISFVAGDLIEGDVAELAVRNGWADIVEDSDHAQAEPAPHPKADDVAKLEAGGA